MKTLAYELKLLCKHNRDGSYRTRVKRDQLLQLAARQLDSELGFVKMHSRSLKPKHVEALVQHWQSQNLAITTIKQRMTALRWWAEKANKQNVIARDNQSYGIANRQYVNTPSKAQTLNSATREIIEDPYVQASLRLAAVFGLRKEEAIKCIPKQADQGDHLQLQASWCKGGKSRSIPITTETQREALNYARCVAKDQSLIPNQYTYAQQKRRYEHLTGKAGLTKLHGLRHQYAQDRYLDLTGWRCPHQGGPTKNELNVEQRKADKTARQIISRELGHERIQIVATYIG